MMDHKPEALLEIIFTYAGKIANERKLDSLLLLMADLGRDLVLADRCTVWLLDRERKVLWTRVAHGISAVEIPAGTGVAGYVIRTQTPYFTNDAYQNSVFNQEVDKKTGYRTQAILAIPLIDSTGKVIGVYQAVNKMTEDRRFSDKDVEHLILAASYAEKTLETAILNEEIENTQKEIIYLMAELGEVRSEETGNHVKRVAEYSRKLALLYGMNKLEAELVKTASPMHDIGKVAIPDAILTKPGALSDVEFDVIKTHTTIGYELLNKSGWRMLRSAAVIAHEHHEKWNGKGYPRRLKEEEIHLYGRITALADVFDALGTNRCYKKAWDLDSCIELIRTEKGVYFDPFLVDCFLENLGDFLAIREKYTDD